MLLAASLGPTVSVTIALLPLRPEPLQDADDTVVAPRIRPAPAVAERAEKYLEARIHRATTQEREFNERITHLTVPTTLH